MAIGPIQIIIISLDTLEHARGEVLAELADLRGRGMIRVVDFLVVTKNSANTVEAVDLSDLSPNEAFEFGALLGDLLGLDTSVESNTFEGGEARAMAVMTGLHGMTLEHVREIGESLSVGAAAALLMIEHTWAIPLRDAIRRVGGVPIAQGFLTPEAVMLVGEELGAIAEAEIAIELAETVAAAATLDALVAVAQSQAIQAQAFSEAAEVVAATEAIKTVAVADAVRTLIIADIIEQEAAMEAIDALARAGLIKESALDEATASITMTPSMDQQ